MIGTLIGLIFLCVLLGVIWWAAMQLWPLIAQYIAEPFLTIIRILFVLILVAVVVYVLIALLQAAGIHVNTFGFR